MEANEQNQSNTTGSLDIPMPPLDYNVQGSDRVVALLVKEFRTMREQLDEVRSKQTLAETGIPKEVLEEHGLITSEPAMKWKRGRGFRPILLSEIQEAKKHSVNEAGAARFLKISHKTYKKYARLYGVYDPKPCIRGKRNIYDPERGKYPLSEILEGKHPTVSTYKIKDKLLRSGKKLPICEMCGFKERRITDNKIPLLLNFSDSNPQNHALENMKIYCLNCTFLCGRGYISHGQHYFDPDFLQGAEKHEIDEEARF